MNKCILPTRIELHRKKSANKRISLSLNWYRNAHFRLNNEAKIKFKKDIRDQINKLPRFKKPIYIEYYLYPARLCDTANFCSVIDKFFCDALKESGKIREDNFRFVTGVKYEYRGMDVKNPRVEAEIYEV